jgi:hypothetical protein
MKVNHKQTNNRQKGYAIAEAAAAACVLVPVTLMVLYAVWQTSIYLYIMSSLNEAARTAARRCAIAYGVPAAGPIGSADSQGPNVAPPQEQAVYSAPTTTVIQGSGSADIESTPLTPNQAFSMVRVAAVLSDNSQFTAYYTPPAVNNQNPAYATGTVKVVATYNGKLPEPDVLGLQNALSMIKINATCTYPLEY